MEIMKGLLPNRNPYIAFEDQWDDPCRISTSKAKAPFMKIDANCVSFSQEDIARLLPYLQAFVETGTIENV